MSWANLNAARSVFQAALDVVVPPVCPRCQLSELRTPSVPLCSTCIASISKPVDWLCSLCGHYCNPYAQREHACPACRQRRHSFDQTLTLGPYEGELRGTIVRMKQSSEQSLTHAIGELLGDRVLACWKPELPDLICPVPMHWLRRTVRRSSSADIIAHGVARRIDRPKVSRLLFCTRLTQKQSLLDIEHRRRNIHGAYGLRGRGTVRGRHIAVVDDTLTTGSTADEISRLLKKHGASRVSVIVAARARRTGMAIRS